MMLSPAQVVVRRVKAHAAGDFTTIYTSTHPDSAFRAHFPTLDEYLRYVQAHSLDQIRIEEFVVETVVEEAPAFFVFAKARYVSEQGASFVFEQHELQKDDGHWRVLASCRLPVTAALYEQAPVTPELFSGQPWF